MTSFLVRSTVRGVELVKAGKWNGLNGPVELTQADLSDAVAAYQDPEVDRAVIKLGHVDPMNDGMPAAGWVENLRLSQDRNTLIGDLVDMPRQLADMLSDAYRRRSAELRRQVTTPSGKKYGTVLTALALLGVQAPAVKGLADVLQQYASEHPGMDDDATQERVDRVQLSDPDTPPVPPTAPAGTEPGNVHAPAGAGQEPQGEEHDMDPKLRAALVKRFKLADDATDEQIAAAVAGDTPEGETTEPGKDGTDAGPAKDTTDAGAHTAVTPNPEAGQAQAASEGTVTVPKATWERLTGQVSDLAARERARETDGLLTAALAQGRLTPPEIASWRESLEDDARRPGALALLATLPQRVAVVELGEANATPADFDEKAWDAQAEAAGL